MSGVDLAALGGIGLNLVCAGISLWQIRKWRDRRAALEARHTAYLRCVGMVAFLARPESGMPAHVRAECAKLVPPDVELEIEIVPGRVH
jgi:hypothetical protein